MKGRPFNFRYWILDYRDIRCSRTFLSLLNVEGNLIAFIEAFKAARIDGGMMYEYIGSVFLLNETEPFLVVKPLNCSVGHCDILLSL
jgi:hypothetical protein